MEKNDSKQIVVGVDGSDSSIQALRRAALIGTAIDARIQAITTWEYSAILESYYPVEGWSPEEDAEKLLADAVEAAFEGAPPKNLTTKVVRGPSARVLISESEHAFMLVVGSRGLGGFAGLLLGSVSAVCAHHAHCPVLIMHDFPETVLAAPEASYSEA